MSSHAVWRQQYYRRRYLPRNLEEGLPNTWSAVGKPSMASNDCIHMHRNCGTRLRVEWQLENVVATEGEHGSGMLFDTENRPRPEVNWRRRLCRRLDLGHEVRIAHESDQGVDLGLGAHGTHAGPHDTRRHVVDDRLAVAATYMPGTDHPVPLPFLEAVGRVKAARTTNT